MVFRTWVDGCTASQRGLGWANCKGRGGLGGLEGGLNDALLFATARKHGCSVLTRKVLDFDFLQQLDPSGKVLFYR